jgi:hypothetical protein
MLGAALSGLERDEQKTVSPWQQGQRACEESFCDQFQDEDQEMQATATTYTNENPVVILKEMKEQGIVGRFIRIHLDGRIGIRTGTPREAYRNGNLLQALMCANFQTSQLKRSGQTVK